MRDLGRDQRRSPPGHQEQDDRDGDVDHPVQVVGQPPVGDEESLREIAHEREKRDLAYRLLQEMIAIAAEIHEA